MDEFDTVSGGDDLIHDTFVLKVKGQPFAIGLYWNNFENKQTAAKEAREAAAKPSIDGDLFCVRLQGSQYGIGYKSHGHAKNMVSLAGALADQRNGSWVGLFVVEGGFYLLAVRDDDVLADTDRFIVDEMQARSKLDDLLLISGWENVFVPEGFDVDGATIATLEELVGRPRTPRLQSTDQIGGVIKIGVGAAVVLALVFGGMYYMQQKSDAEWKEQMEALSKSFQNSISPEEEIVIPPMPWEGKSTAESYLSSCVEAMSKATFSVPGWDTVGLLCEGTMVNMVLQRAGDLGEGGGPLSWVDWAVQKIGLDSASITPTDDNQVVVSWGFSPDDVYPVVVDTVRLTVAERYLRLKLEDLFTPVRFDNGATGSLEFYATKSFTFDTPFQPTEFASVLREVPGLTIERVILDLTEFSYRVEGSIHEQTYFPETANASLN